MEDPITLWWLSLGIFATVVVVVAVLLALIIVAAKRIERTADAIWAAGKEIAGNTVSIWMLEKTNGFLGRSLEAIRSLDRSAASIERHLETLSKEEG